MVDDAIVIVEGAAHGIEKGLTPKEASIKAMDELTGPVLGITFVLMAVFLPAAFLPGITGQLYRQFALVIAATAVISAVNALTLKPVQCSQYLQAADRQAQRVLPRLQPRLQRLRKRVRPPRQLGGPPQRRHDGWCYVGLMVVTFWGFVSIPTGFIPEEDQGYAIVGIQLPDAAAIERTRRRRRRRSRRSSKETPGIAHLLTIGGIRCWTTAPACPTGR